jgi:hypothetical protein
MLKSVPEANRDHLIALAMLMLYSMALLWIGLAVTTVAWLAASLVGLAVAATALGARQPRLGVPHAARRVLRAVMSDRDTDATP